MVWVGFPISGSLRLIRARRLRRAIASSLLTRLSIVALGARVTRRTRRIAIGTSFIGRRTTVVRGSLARPWIGRLWGGSAASLPSAFAGSLASVWAVLLRHWRFDCRDVSLGYAHLWIVQPDK